MRVTADRKVHSVKTVDEFAVLVPCGSVRRRTNEHDWLFVALVAEYVFGDGYVLSVDFRNTPTNAQVIQRTEADGRNSS